MKMIKPIPCLLLLLLAVLPASVNANTYVIPFSEIRQAVESTGDSPDDVIRTYLAGLIRDELDAMGFDLNGGLVFSEFPVEEITEIIETDCDFLRPYQVHTDATTATVTMDDSSSLTLDLNSIRSIQILADLTGIIETDATAWVRWGQDIIFVGNCVKINTDHGWVGLSLPIDINLDLMLDLNPSYDNDQVAIVVDKHAVLAGQAQFNGGVLQHEFGTASLTDFVLNAFEDDLLAQLSAKGEQALADAISDLNYRLDGLDENGVPDTTITAFNGPTTFVLEVSEEDQAFVQELLLMFGIPDLVISILEDRGIEILLQLAILEGAERDAYLAALGAAVSCDALFGTYEAALDVNPIYALNGQVCERADLSGPDAGAYFTDTLCTDQVAFKVTDDADFCLAQFGDQAKTLLGNAAAWVADTNQPNDPLPNVTSRSWTTVPSTQLDLGVLSLQGNHQPYMKQLLYKTIVDVPRGNGSCELEMRVYKSDITGHGKPLIALHGGTWRHRGFSFMGLEAGISHLTERGFIVFAPFYRLVGESDGNSECNAVSWHEVTEDVESALDWVKENGTALGAANERVNVYGQSAGAHLAAWLAAHRSADVRKALLYYAPTDILEFLDGSVPIGGPYEAFRGSGLDSLSRFYGAQNGSNELHLELINFAGLTVELLGSNWQALIPDTVFDLSQIDPLVPPLYIARCASATQIDLSAINLSMPPAALTLCMKEDLSEFLIDNSFNHLLEDEEVSMHAVQGAADTLVPYQQALKLCGAIDNSVLPTAVVDALTTYACGAGSQIQIIAEAEHALELGLCVDPLCPAGEPGSPTRNAVATAINASYLWLLEDPPIISDSDGDGVPDHQDDFPNDPNEIVDTDGDGIGNNADTDDDNDGILDDWELSHGLNPLDAADALEDDDADGVTNLDEYLAGTDPQNSDTDGDNVLDGIDNCPATVNPAQVDIDHDNIGDACDSFIDPVLLDFNGDGKADILWRHAVSGLIVYWQMDGALSTVNATVDTVSDPNWQIVGTGDYNGDTKADILWRHAISGQLVYWQMDGAVRTVNASVGSVSDLNWQIVGNSDHNGDGKADILWRHAISGQIVYWQMAGAVPTLNATVDTVSDPNWQIVGTGDHNGDGKADILFRHAISGQIVYWQMDGAVRTVNASVSTVSDQNWQIMANGDHNGDDKDDILWRHAISGQLVYWQMNGATISSGSTVTIFSDIDWKLAGSGDYNGDGMADMLWRHDTSGEVNYWQMDGAAIGSSSTVTVVGDLSWNVLNVN